MALEKLEAKRERLERIDRQEIQLHEFKDELVALNCAAAEVLDAATKEGADADRAEIHSRVQSQVVNFECRVRAVQASWADHNYETTLTADEIKEYVTQHRDEHIIETRHALQKVFMKYRRFVRGLQDMYDQMKATETRRWGHGAAANALEQSLFDTDSSSVGRRRSAERVRLEV